MNERGGSLWPDIAANRRTRACGYTSSPQTNASADARRATPLEQGFCINL